MLLKKISRYIKIKLLGLNGRVKRSPISDEINRLMSIPRFIPGTSRLFGAEFRFVDAATFLSGYEEILNKRVYEFKSDVEDPLIIDCGANIGLSVYYFKSLYPKARVKAFEPDPNIFEVLRKNVETSKFKDVELFRTAIWTDNGSVSFHLEGGLSGRIPKEGDVQSRIQVPCTRLKDHIRERVDFLKIDIEGAEFAVLKDIEDDLSRVRNIFIEYHSHITEPQYLGDILGMLSDIGFRYHIQEAFTRKKPFVDSETCLGMDLQLNVFAYRQEPKKIQGEE